MLLATLTGLLIFIGRWLGGTGGMVFAFMMAIVMNGGAYWFSDKLALSMSGAREVTAEEAPQLHGLVGELARRAEVPMPRVYLIDSEAPNAFATGRDPAHGAVAVTSGIMRLLNRDELAGVIAHELGHIKNRDTLISAIAATVAGAVTMIANMAQWALIFGGFGGSDEEEGGAGGLVGGLFMIILAPIAATLVQLAISRTREYGADAAGARIAGDPIALASALRKLETWSTRTPLAVNPATAHMYIVNPLTGRALAGLFSTHPPTQERITRLEQMALGQNVIS
ncbi:MAG: zinc metalloprotease HtpX [Caldilineaceae bacterium]|nr:zinc metalloprotease HtpX [Caldilineaceae bacterium]